jgi:hypothetical protein
MQYGLCELSNIPVRADANDRSEMITQLLYGEHFEILTQKNNWTQIRIAFDQYEGWISTNQIKFISEKEFKQLHKEELNCSVDLIEFVHQPNHYLLPIVLGSCVGASHLLSHHFDGHTNASLLQQMQLADVAKLYINSPYLWGGRTPFGIDCSGFTQMVYKLNGVKIPRDAYQQAELGAALSFIEESSPGDLAFFDNDEGKIVHVGIILEDNFIIHAHGKVRIDRIDHTGIFNTETKKYSHQLRVIKKII